MCFLIFLHFSKKLKNYFHWYKLWCSNPICQITGMNSNLSKRIGHQFLSCYHLKIQFLHYHIHSVTQLFSSVPLIPDLISTAIKMITMSSVLWGMQISYVRKREPLYQIGAQYEQLPSGQNRHLERKVCIGAVKVLPKCAGMMSETHWENNITITCVTMNT